jgi:hypothetical protein
MQQQYSPHCALQAVEGKCEFPLMLCDCRAVMFPARSTALLQALLGDTVCVEPHCVTVCAVRRSWHSRRQWRPYAMCGTQMLYCENDNKSA